MDIPYNMLYCFSLLLCRALGATLGKILVFAQENLVFIRNISITVIIRKANEDKDVIDKFWFDSSMVFTVCA